MKLTWIKNSFICKRINTKIFVRLPQSKGLVFYGKRQKIILLILMIRGRGLGDLVYRSFLQMIRTSLRLLQTKTEVVSSRDA